MHYDTWELFEPITKTVNKIGGKLLKDLKVTTAAIEDVSNNFPGTIDAPANTQITFSKSLQAMKKEENGKQNLTDYKSCLLIKWKVVNKANMCRNQILDTKMKNQGHLFLVKKKHPTKIERNKIIFKDALGNHIKSYDLGVDLLQMMKNNEKSIIDDIL